MGMIFGKNKRVIVYGLMLVISAVFAVAAHTDGTADLKSGKNSTLIEMFTSQGCSSCPPAESWLNDLVGSDKLWDEIVPVAFHVDYWDHLGWYGLAVWVSRANEEVPLQAAGMWLPGE